MTRNEFIEKYDKTPGWDARVKLIIDIKAKMINPPKNKEFDVYKLIYLRNGTSAYSRMPEWYRKRLRHVKKERI